MAKTPLPDTLLLTRHIRLVADHLRAVGPYLHGQDYEVPAAEAARLVPARGFIYVDEPGGITAPAEPTAPTPVPTEPQEAKP